jgi:hypothetical protein
VDFLSRSTIIDIKNIPDIRIKPVSLDIPRNPFAAGAGKPPPYLAGRQAELDEIQALLKQENITKNLIISGIRGIGKTVLLQQIKPIAQKQRWRCSLNEINPTRAEAS